MLTHNQLIAIQKAWCQETCYPKYAHTWHEHDPTYGQCAVTCLLIQDLLGGEILWSATNNHYWNLLPDHTELDLTRAQFGTSIDTGDKELVPREEVLLSKTAKTQERYILLKGLYESLLIS